MDEEEEEEEGDDDLRGFHDWVSRDHGEETRKVNTEQG